MHFANPDVVDDVDAFGSFTGTFHWVDATSVYGDVLVQSSSFALSGPNVLSNGGQPILLLFNGPVDLASFSIQQDASSFGNAQANGTELVFLDETGHAIAGSGVSYTQYTQPGLPISSGPVSHVSGVLLAGIKDYDNLSVSSVPEPESLALLSGGLGTMGLVARRRRNGRA